MVGAVRMNLLHRCDGRPAAAQIPPAEWSHDAAAAEGTDGSRRCHAPWWHDGSQRQSGDAACASVRRLRYETTNAR